MTVDGKRKRETLRPPESALTIPSKSALTLNLVLIEVITFVHQHQRKRKLLPVVEGEAEPRPCVFTTRADIRLANRLFASIFIDTVGELSHQSRSLLAHLRDLLEKKRKETSSTSPEAKDPETPIRAEPLFEPAGLTRREIREALRWSDYQLKICLEQLEGLEYVVTVTGRQGKRYLYALTPQGELATSGSDPDELARRLGLTDPDTLPDLDG